MLTKNIGHYKLKGTYKYNIDRNFDEGKYVKVIARDK